MSRKDDGDMAGMELGLVIKMRWKLHGSMSR